MTTIFVVIGCAAAAGLLIASLIIRRSGRNTDTIYKHVSVRNGVSVKDKSYGSTAESFRNPNDTKGTRLVDGSYRVKCYLELTNMGTGEVHKYEIADKLRIGRSKNSVGYEQSLILPLDSHISGNHCMIMLDKTGLILQDLNSHNHTYINNQQILTATRLQNDDVITVGYTRLKVRYELR